LRIPEAIYNPNRIKRRTSFRGGARPPTRTYAIHSEWSVREKQDTARQTGQRPGIRGRCAVPGSSSGADSQGTNHSVRADDGYHSTIVVELSGPGASKRFGKLASEIVGSADVINDLYAGPGPMLPKSGCNSTTVGAACSCCSTGTHSSSPTRVPSHPVWPKGQLHAFRDVSAFSECIGDDALIEKSEASQLPAFWVMTTVLALACHSWTDRSAIWLHQANTQYKWLQRRWI
jgi:hypothetical protein